jgi:hypothetical protein
VVKTHAKQRPLSSLFHSRTDTEFIIEPPSPVWNYICCMLYLLYTWRRGDFATVLHYSIAWPKKPYSIFPRGLLFPLPLPLPLLFLFIVLLAPRTVRIFFTQYPLTPTAEPQSVAVLYHPFAFMGFWHSGLFHRKDPMQDQRAPPSKKKACAPF